MVAKTSTPVALACWLIHACVYAGPIDFVTVGDVSNPGVLGPGTLGAVDYEYRIAKYEVTIGQYAEFLNAVARSDPHQLYDEQMSTSRATAGILRSGLAGSYAYTPIEGTANKPITHVSFLDAIRFVNWLHNGRGSGDTENGAYNIKTANATHYSVTNNLVTITTNAAHSLGIGDAVQLESGEILAEGVVLEVPNTNQFTIKYNAPDGSGVIAGAGEVVGLSASRLSGAKYWLPSEAEYFKAALYSPLLNDGAGGWYRYATQSGDLFAFQYDDLPGNVVGPLPDPLPKS
jgi:hypothetical protein